MPGNHSWCAIRAAQKAGYLVFPECSILQEVLQDKRNVYDVCLTIHFCASQDNLQDLRQRHDSSCPADGQVVAEQHSLQPAEALAICRGRQ